MIEISTEAADYLKSLLAKQEDPETAIRIFVAQPGTPNAETCIAYCVPGEEESTDSKCSLNGINTWIEGKSEPFLKEATIGYQEDELGGQLTIKAPNARLPQITETSSLEEKINYIIQNEINPGLASHGGMVSLVELTNENIAVLQFGGGCQGCSAVDMTLKGGVEQTLMAQLPELKGIEDVTDHSHNQFAYYQ